MKDADDIFADVPTLKEFSADAPIHDLIKKLARARGIVERLEDELKRAKQEEELREKIVVDALTKMGQLGGRFVSGLTAFTVQRVYLHKLSDVTQEQLCSALKENDLGFCVSEQYSSARLKSWIREKVTEIAENHGEVPPDLTELLPEEVRPYVSAYQEPGVNVLGIKQFLQKELIDGSDDSDSSVRSQELPTFPSFEAGDH